MLRKLLLLLTCSLVYSNANSFEAKYEYPRAFIENKAQFDGRNKLTDSQILYAIDHGPFQVYFTNKGITYRMDKKLPRQKWDKSKPIASQQEWETILARRKAVRMETTLIHVSFEGANPNPFVKAEFPLDEYFIYGMGSNNLHYNNIKGYQKLTYQNLYPGIDLEFTFHPDKGFKYQFVVQAGADPSLIQWQYDTNVPIYVDAAGNARIETPFGDIVDHAPVSFQGVKLKVNTRFVLNQNRISFDLEKYDRNQSLIIDPWVVFPPSPNSNKVWEVETDNAGNVYAYMGDSPFYLRKYSAAGALQWSYFSSWDSSGFWVGGMVTHPNGDTYITTGSNGEIRKITSSGALAWYNNPNGLTSYEYWSLAFNCDLTKLVVGGSRATFSIPFPVIRGTMMEINLANGSIVSTTVVGYGNISGIPPRIQEASSICASPNGNFYFLTLDTVGKINNQLNTIGFKVPTQYNFDYYIPGYGFGTKQPISAIRANASAFYTHDGQNLHKRDLNTGAVMATASIPSGIINTVPIFGTKTQGNGGLDLDNCGNVYVGSGNGVYKYDSALNLLASANTSGAVYDVDVSANGDVAVSGINFVATVTLSACSQTAFVCGNPVSATVASTAVSCSGSCDGTATANAIGGTPSYNYLWSNGASTSSITGLCAGNYTVTVTDAAGTSSVQTVNVGSPAPIVATPSSISQVTCNGANNGSVVVAVTGGTGNLTYLWNTNPTQTGTSLNNLTAGNYTLTVTDASGCTDTLSVIITEPNPISLQVSSVAASCSLANGSALVTASGGTPSFSYSWNTVPVQSTALATGLNPGTYLATVTDVNGCVDTISATVGQLPAVSLQVSSTPASCALANGSATVVTSGGTPPFNYAWNTVPVQSTALASGLSAGTYTVTITDANGCIDTISVNVGQVSAVSLQVSATPASCSLANGSATVLPSGGIPPYNYNWNSVPAQTTSQAIGLAVGNYTVIVTDASGCSSQSQVVITGSTPPTLLASSIPACGENNGSAVVNVSGGTAPFAYLWSSGGVTSPSISGVPSGNYQCTVTDANGCSQTASINVIAYPLPDAFAGADATIGSGQSITLSASGGIAYSWTPSAGLLCDTCQSTVASPFVATTYCVVVTDLNGCTDTDCVTLSIEEPCGDVYIPSAFSPDGTNDPENDRFCVYGRCITTLNLQVYDRWGKLVFESNDPSGCWDGTFKGSQVNTGVYMYVAKVSLANGQNTVIKGDVTLMR